MDSLERATPLNKNTTEQGRDNTRMSGRSGCQFISDKVGYEDASLSGPYGWIGCHALLFFGRKSGETGKIASVYLDMSNPFRIFKRLQEGGEC